VRFRLGKIKSGIKRRAILTLGKNFGQRWLAEQRGLLELTFAIARLVTPAGSRACPSPVVLL
jgi:hypothetical protein